MSGRQLATAIVAITLLAFVLPPLAAHSVHVRRIANSYEDARRMAAALAGDREGLLAEAMADAGERPTMFRGPGAVPKFASGAEWPEGRPVLSAGVSPDPWGNQPLIAVGRSPKPFVVVLSAGPNGIVETPFARPWPAAGDDIAAIVNLPQPANDAARPSRGDRPQ